MITLDLSILNQKGTPMFYSDIFANRPAAGVVGRIFISTDTYSIYRDTGSAWDQIGGSGSGITGSGTAGTLPIWTSSSALGDSSLLEGSTKISTIKDIQADGYYLTGMTGGSGALYWTSDRVTLANYNVGGIVHIEVNGGIASTIFGTDLSLTNYGYIAATPTLTAANNASSLASYGINTLSYAAGFSSNNIGALYGGMAAFNLQTFAGSATFAQANVASAMASINSIDFSSAGSTITMTQSSGIRVMSGSQSQLQYQGTNSGTITHAAISQNLGFYRPSGASGTLTITNAYSHLINALDDYGAGFSFTNRWGIYQAGASDTNYFAATTLVGTTISGGYKFEVNGTGRFNGEIFSKVATGNIAKISLTSGTFNSYISAVDGNLNMIFVNTSTISGFNNVSDIQFCTNNNTTTPAFKLDVNGFGIFNNGTNSTNGIKVISALSGSLFNGGIQFLRTSVLAGSKIEPIRDATFGGVGLNFYVTTNNAAEIAGTYTQSMTLSRESKLGIGISTPDDLLTLYSSSSSIISLRDGIVNQFYGGYIKGYGVSGFGGRLDIGVIDNNTYRSAITIDEQAFFIRFFTNLGGTLSQKMFLANDGNLIINSNTNPGQKLYLNGSLRIDGQSSGTAGGSSGQHLIINLDGTTYKIALLNP